MYPVIPQYNTDMNASLRPETYVKIVFGVSDPDAPVNSTLTDNGHLYYSNVESSDLGIDVTKTYETLEHNRFVLNGRNLLAKKINTLFQGYVGNEISDASGTFTVPPKITISFTQFFEFAGLSINFDSTKTNYPSSFTVKTYNNDVIAFEKTYSPTDPRFVINDRIPQCNKIEIIANKMNVGYRRFRVSEIIYGIVDTLYDADISDCKFNSTAEIMAFSLPKYDFSFNIFDVAGKYDPEKPDNLLKYLENGQSVKFSIGQKLTDGSVEWIPISNGFTNGEVSVSDAGFTKNISVSSTSILEFLNMTYDEGIYYTEGRTLYQLAQDVIGFAGYAGTMVLDEHLKTITTHVVLGGHTVKECLQLIANAANCAIWVNRNGQIVIKHGLDPLSSFEFGFNKMLTVPKMNRTPQLKQLNSSYVKISFKEPAEIAKLTNITATNTEYSITFNSAINITYSLTGLTVVGIPKKFANKLVITLNGNGSIVVKGQSIEYTQVAFSKKYNELGSELKVTNELIDDKVFAETYCDNINEYFKRRSDYSFTNRGYPELDLLDGVKCQTNYQGEINGTVVENGIDFNGALSGTSKVLAIDDF